MESMLEKLINAKYIFAKTMPKNPHWYTLRVTWHSEKVFDECVQFIRDNGAIEYYARKQYTCYYLYGYKYWTMGNPINKTKLINRAAKPMITHVSKSEIEKFMPIAKKEDICFANNTNYYGLLDSGELKGFGGLSIYSNKVVIKSLYVQKKYRGNGVFKELLKHLMGVASKDKTRYIEANCTDMSIREFKRLGFEKSKLYKNCVKMIHENL